MLKKLSLISALCISLVGCSSNVVNLQHGEITKAQYDQLQNGMSEEQVKEIVGTLGEKEVDSDISGYHGEVYGLKGTGDIGANASLQFMNNRLTVKAQMGLQ